MLVSERNPKTHAAPRPLVATLSTARPHRRNSRRHSVRPTIRPAPANRGKGKPGPAILVAPAPFRRHAGIKIAGHARHLLRRSLRGAVHVRRRERGPRRSISVDTRPCRIKPAAESFPTAMQGRSVWWSVLCVVVLGWTAVISAPPERTTTRRRRDRASAASKGTIGWTQRRARLAPAMHDERCRKII